MAVDSADPTSASPASFIFGGDTGMTYEALKRRRAIATALAERSRAFPKTLGEGLTYFGEALGDVMGERRLAELEKVQRARDVFTPPTAATAAPVASAAPAKTSWIDDAVPSGPARAADATVPPLVPTTSASGAVNPPVADTNAMSKVGEAIGRLEPDPTMRTYLAQLAGREDATGGQQVSPTGAAGPFQFTRGTGRQYGLVGDDGDRRTDVDASVVAAQQLTRDNAQTFMKINGRVPTLSELALMHQQGGVTGARMVAGTGNAPARNLAVNNVDPSLGPQDAAAKIQAYYKMPNTQMPEDYVGGGGREAIARALTAPEVPQANPTDAGSAAPQDGGSPVQVASLDPTVGMNAVAPREAASNPPISTDIAPAPAPNVQVAQAGGALPPGAPAAPGAPVRPVPKTLPFPNPGPEPKLPPPTPEMSYYLKEAQNPMRSDASRAEAQRRYIEQRTQQHEDFVRHWGIWKEDTQQKQKYELATPEHDLMLEEKRGQILAQEYEQRKRADEEKQRARYGNLPEYVVKDLEGSRDKAHASVLSLEAMRNAKEALDAGTVVGPLAKVKLAYYRTRALAGDPEAQRIVANTESFSASLGPTVMSAVKSYGGPQVSNSDREYAAAMSGADISLSEGAIRRIMAIGERSANAAISEHRLKLDRELGDKPPLRRYFDVPEPQPAIPIDRGGAKKDAPVVDVGSEAEANALAPGTRFRLNGRTGTVR